LCLGGHFSGLSGIEYLTYNSSWTSCSLIVPGIPGNKAWPATAPAKRIQVTFIFSVLVPLWLFFPVYPSFDTDIQQLF